MSDPFNTPAHEDPQSSRIRTDASEQRRLREGGFGDKTKVKEDTPKSISSLYQEGIAEFKRHGYLVTAAVGGPYTSHTVEKTAKPPTVRGITYPSWFQPYQPIKDQTDLTVLENIVNGLVGSLSADAREFWAPLAKPHRGDSDLSLYTQKILAIQKESQAKEIRHELHMTFDPAGNVLGSRSPNPRTWVPDREWFDPALHDLTLEDVFTIFPKAELQILLSILGRVGVGPSKQIPANGGAPLIHTFRSAAVVVGKDAGLGKSTLFDGLNEALGQCGFNVSTFRSTSERFGLKSIAESHLSYKDDTAMKSLRQFLSSEETKILVTGGLLHTEEKFQAAESVKARTVLIANTNDWDPNVMFDLDSGIMDRIKPLSTYREVEMVRLVGRVGGVSKASPDLHPFNHLPWIAERLGVDEAALFLWCLRLASDHFYEVITQKDSPSGNALKDEIQFWTSQLRIKWHAHTNSSLASAMVLSMAMRNPKRKTTELTPKALVDYLNAFYFIGTDPSTVGLVERMKKDWKDLGCPSNHYYNGFREVRYETVKKALDKGCSLMFNETSAYNNEASFNEQIKGILSLISLRDGFKVSQSHVHMSSVWQSVRIEEPELREKAEEYFHSFPPDYQARIRSDSDAYDAWMTDDNYTPDRAEEHIVLAEESETFKALLSRTAPKTK